MLKTDILTFKFINKITATDFFNEKIRELRTSF